MTPRRRRSAQSGGALGIALIALSVAFAPQTIAQEASPGAMTSVQDLMIALVDPSADAIWDAVGTITTVEGVEERRPHSPEDWQALHIHAVRLVASANLLADTHRPVAAQGVNSENPGIELDPEQTAWLIDDQPAVWRAMARALLEQSQVMLDAVQRRDAEAIFDNGEALDLACEGCHRHFWYPDNVSDVPRLDH